MRDKAKQKAWHQNDRRTHKAEYAAYQKDYYRSNPGIYLINACRSRARTKGIPFNLTQEDIIIPEFCPVLGIRLEHGTKGFRESSPSIDRVDPIQGYVKGNVVVISFRANRMKMDATLEELEKLVEWLREEKAKRTSPPPS